MTDHKGPHPDAGSAHLSPAIAAWAAGDDRVQRLLLSASQLSDWPLFPDCCVKLLIDGPQTYDAMLDAIHSASSTVHLESYVLADDEVGQRFADALLERCAAGVTVRVMYDSFGSRQSDDSFFAKLEQGGVELCEYNPINPANGGNPLDANNRSHRKLLIVDSRAAFTGGVNITDFYTTSSGIRRQADPDERGWRDTHIRVEGPAVTALEQMFVDNWKTRREAFELPSRAEHDAQSAGDSVVAVLRAEGGDGGKSAIYHAYLDALSSAAEKIWITQAYFAPGNTFEDLLGSAAERGTDVRILVPGYSDTDMVVHASRWRYGRLLRRGVKIYEVHKTILHAKTAVIDGFWSTVGSSNLDPRSILHNDEVNAVIFGTAFGKQMEEQFLKDVDAARQITLKEYRRRPWLNRIKEFFSWAIEYWL